MKIAVLTSGGDSAGMNAVVRAVVKAGILKYVLSYLSFFFPNIGDGALKIRIHQQRM
jgi:6-phosphofructokinase